MSGLMTVMNGGVEKPLQSNNNGQNTMANSQSITIASDQTPVPIKGDTTLGASIPATAQLTGMKAFGSVLGPLQTCGFNINGEAIDHWLATGLYVYTNPGGTFTGDLMRHPSVFKTGSATASGNTAVWTPTTGFKFRLMRYKIEVTQNAAAAAAGVITLSFQDSATPLGIAHSVFVPSAAGTTFGPGWSSEWIDLGNGYLSAAANNVLNINLSAALTAGNVRVIACGTEE